VKHLKANGGSWVEPTAPPVGVGLVGASGRMGRCVAALLDEDAATTLVLEADEAGIRRRSDASVPMAVVVDLSSEAGTRSALALAREASAALLVGTTGLGDATLAALRGAASSLPVMVAPNLSVGAAILRRLVATAARLAGPDWDLDLVESHHRHKRDAPSGTALALRDAIEAVAGAGSLDGRIHAIRGGGTIGEHELRLATSDETLLLQHRAIDRSAFARGAVRAARWLATAPAGWHEFESVFVGRLVAEAPAADPDLSRARPR
jgi:4-hydroxy-tetrahydrodipicolinate reductase